MRRRPLATESNRYGVPFFTAVRCVDELDPELLDPLELDDPDDPDEEELDELEELERGCELPLLLDPLPCLYPCPFTTLPCGCEPCPSRVTITIGLLP